MRPRRGTIWAFRPVPVPTLAASPSRVYLVAKTPQAPAGAVTLESSCVYDGFKANTYTKVEISENNIRSAGNSIYLGARPSYFVLSFSFRLLFLSSHSLAPSFLSFTCTCALSLLPLPSVLYRRTVVQARGCLEHPETVSRNREFT